MKLRTMGQLIWSAAVNCDWVESLFAFHLSSPPSASSSSRSFAGASPSLVTNPLSALPSPLDYGLALGNLLFSSPKILSTQICFPDSIPVFIRSLLFPTFLHKFLPIFLFLDQMQVSQWIHGNFIFLSLPRIYYYYFVFLCQKKLI